MTTISTTPSRIHRSNMLSGLAGWIRHNLFNGYYCSIITILLMAGLVWFAANLIDWAVINSTFVSTNSTACEAKSGACWAVIPEKYRVMLFGFYSYDDHWRPTLAIIIFICAIVISCIPRFWHLGIIIPCWLSVSLTVFILLRGGVFGLTYQETRLWGGLPLTLIIFFVQLAIGLPLGILFALGRRSSLQTIRITCVIIIEIVRAIPPIALLFFAAIVLPLFLPSGANIDKLLRIFVAMALLQGCLQAEVVRGGLQAIPDGQLEASKALGLGYWETQFLIILPQALRIVIPGITNQTIQAFKNSTLVIIVGMFDFLNTTTAAISDPTWIKYFVEAYLFAAFIYFCGCWLISFYGRFLERHFKLETY